MTNFQLRRLSVTSGDLKSFKLSIPDSLVQVEFHHHLAHESFRQLQSGLISPDEIIYVDGEWLSYFAERDFYYFWYKFLLAADDDGISIGELQAHPGLSADALSHAAIVANLERIIQNIHLREHPVTAGSLPDYAGLMKSYQSYTVNDLSLSKQDFYRLIWGFIPFSREDHWMTWFDVEAGTLQVHWHWSMHLIYQMRFEQREDAHDLIEVLVSSEVDNKAFGLSHAKGLISYLISLNPYRIEKHVHWLE